LAAKGPSRSSWQGTTTSAEQTVALGAALAVHLRAGDVVALLGELGAGKTQMVRGLAAGLGLRATSVASPTFVMMQEYVREKAEGGRRKAEVRQEQTSLQPTAYGLQPDVLVHIDAYRLRSLEDLESIGFGPEAQAEMRRGAVVVVEWADRLGALLGDEALEIRLDHRGAQERQIVIAGHASWVERVAAMMPDLDRAVQTPGATGACPMCGRPVGAKAAFTPFCSERCKMADLGGWLGGKYSIGRPINQSDLEET
jgi:tRNA threonylcarbamoyladenosine biosynthesis protein TsaE